MNDEAKPDPITTAELDKLRGRRPKLTMEVLKTVVRAVEQGHYRAVAARFAGVTSRMLHRWMCEGRKRPDTIYGYFRTKVREAEAVSELNLVARVQRAARIDAKHAEWLLARRFPSRWGRRREMGEQAERRPMEVKLLIECAAAEENGRICQQGQQWQPGNRIAQALPAELVVPAANGNGPVAREHA